MRKFHLLVVSGLVGAIAACLMVRTPNAAASIETRPAVVVAQAEPIPEGDAAAAAPAPGAPAAGAPAGLESGPPPNDPVLNEALAGEKEQPAAPPEHPASSEPPKAKKSLKDSRTFAQTPAHKPARDNAGVKSKKGKKKSEGKHPKKKKKKKQ